MEIITSAQNATIKALARLKTKKERDATRTFLVEGWHMLEEAHAAGLLDRVFQVENEKPFPDAVITYCAQNVLNKLSSQKSDARWIGLCHMPEIDASQKPARLLLLDCIQDPGNLGTLIRSAHSFGIEQILCSPDTADAFGPKALQSSQGALFHIPVLYTDLLSSIEGLKQDNIPVFGAALHQDSIELHDLSIPEQYAIVIGNEGRGISDPVLQACTKSVHIEMKTFESLNAAIAGSILLYAFQFPGRQD